MKRPYKRILVGPVEIAGYYRNLCEGFKQLGVPYDFITYLPHPYGYGGETKQPLLLRLARRLSQSRRSKDSYLLLILFTLPAAMLRMLWSLYAIFRYDVFIVGFGGSFLYKNLDLLIIRRLGKTVISNMGHGSEARPPYLDGAQQSKEGVFPTVDALFEACKIRKSRLDFHARHCSLIIGTPAFTTQFSPVPMINQFALGMPMQCEDSEDCSTVSIDEGDCKANKRHVVRVLHSPSHPAAKGTPLIVEAIENLKRRGYAIDFILLHGCPFKEVIFQLRQCDFVIDQVFSDSPLGGFATEAAWYGKPAVVGGYGLEQLKQFAPPGMWPPSKTCHPTKIEQAIEELIIDVDQRERLGREAKKFVREKWNSLAVASRFMQLIEGNIPADWWLDPKEVVYLEGGCQSADQTKQSIRSLVSAYGVESLQLSHRPELEKAILEFAGL